MSSQCIVLHSHLPYSLLSFSASFSPLPQCSWWQLGSHSILQENWCVSPFFLFPFYRILTQVSLTTRQFLDTTVLVLLKTLIWVVLLSSSPFLFVVVDTMPRYTVVSSLSQRDTVEYGLISVVKSSLQSSSSSKDKNPSLVNRTTSFFSSIKMPSFLTAPFGWDLLHPRTIWIAKKFLPIPLSHPPSPHITPHCARTERYTINCSVHSYLSFTQVRQT